MAKAKSPTGSKPSRPRSKKEQSVVNPTLESESKTAPPASGAGEFASDAEMVSKDEVRRETEAAAVKNKTVSDSSIVPPAATTQPKSAPEPKGTPEVKSYPQAKAPAASETSVQAENAPLAENTRRTDGTFHPEIKPETRKLEVMKNESRKNLVPINLEDEIRRRAYELYLQRGMGNGYEAEDWFHAEREIRQRYRQQSA